MPRQACCWRGRRHRHGQRLVEGRERMPSLRQAETIDASQAHPAVGAETPPLLSRTRLRSPLHHPTRQHCHRHADGADRLRRYRCTMGISRLPFKYPAIWNLLLGSILYLGAWDLSCRLVAQEIRFAQDRSEGWQLSSLRCTKDLGSVTERHEPRDEDPNIRPPTDKRLIQFSGNQTQ